MIESWLGHIGCEKSRPDGSFIEVFRMKKYDMLMCLTQLKRYVAMLEDAESTVVFMKVEKIQGANQFVVSRDELGREMVK